MKKLKLNLQDLGEVLSREQLKSIAGGSGSGSGNGSGSGSGRYCYCGGGSDPESCIVSVNENNPKNCTEICEEADC